MKYIIILFLFIIAIVVVAMFEWEKCCRKHNIKAGKYDIELVDGAKSLGSGSLIIEIDSPHINLVKYSPYVEIEYPYKVLSADFNLTADGISVVSPKWRWLKGSVLSFRGGDIFEKSAYLECVPKVYDYSMYFDIEFEQALKGSISINSWGKGIPIGDVKLIKNSSK